MSFSQDAAASQERLELPILGSATELEERNLRAFDEMDFNVFSRRDWARFHESHGLHVRVHFPDGHLTDGIEVHIKDMDAMFVYAPDTHIAMHPMRIAQDEWTAVTGVMRGTFTEPMPDGHGGLIQPTGKEFSINMATFARWNDQGTMDEEWLYWDNQTYMQQLGLG